MASAVSIRAFFKQATIKGGTATLQFEVLMENANALPMMRKNGKYVILTAEDTQQAMDFDDETGEVWDD